MASEYDAETGPGRYGWFVIWRTMSRSSLRSGGRRPVEISTEALRRWVPQAEVDAGRAPGGDVGVGQGDQGTEAEERRARADHRISSRPAAFLRAEVRPATPLICRFITEHRARFGVAGS